VHLCAHKELITMSLDLKDERMGRATTGVSSAELAGLGQKFTPKYKSYPEKIRPDRANRRKPGGGRHGVLPTAAHKVFFCLFYLKNYPTFDVLAQRFGMARRSAHESLKRYLPILPEVLEEEGVLPAEAFANAGEMAEYLKKKTLKKSLSRNSL